MVETTSEERTKFCDLDFYNLALVLMRNDSASYTFIVKQKAREAADKEFVSSNQFMMEEYIQTCCDF